MWLDSLALKRLGCVTHEVNPPSEQKVGIEIELGRKDGGNLQGIHKSKGAETGKMNECCPIF